MSTLTTSQKSPKMSVRSRVRKPKTMEAFLQWDQPEGLYKYEWVDGELEKTEYMMKTTELTIVKNIKRAFYQTELFREGGELFAEVVIAVNETRARIPDLAAFSNQQIAEVQEVGQPVPSFAIEIISPSESGFKIEQKTLDYFGAGVQVLWQIYPNIRMVKVLTSPRDVAVCFEQDVCSAAPAIPDLQLTVEDLFGEEIASS